MIDKRTKTKNGKRLFGAVAAIFMSLGAAAPAFAVSPPFAYTEEEWAMLRDNILEYGEIPNLIKEYNVVFQNNDETYKKLRSQKTSEKGREELEETADRLHEQAADMADIMSDPMMALLTNSYSQLLYASHSMESGALQVEQQIESYIIDGPLMKHQFDHIQAMLTATAQDLMISHEKLLVNQELVEKSEDLLKAVLESTERQKNLGMATENDVLGAQQNVKNLQTSKMQIESGIRSIRQNLCLLTGWDYDASPEIRPIPDPDVAYLEHADVQADIIHATENNYMLKYNKRSLENTTEEYSKENLKRTIREKEQSISKSITSLYDAAGQARRELEEAQNAVMTAQKNLDTSKRQKELGSIGDLQFMQVQNAYDSAVSKEKTARLSLFQAIETYRRAVEGYLAA